MDVSWNKITSGTAGAVLGKKSTIKTRGISEGLAGEMKEFRE